MSKCFVAGLSYTTLLGTYMWLLHHLVLRLGQRSEPISSAERSLTTCFKRVGWGERAGCRHDLSVARSSRRIGASIAPDVLECLAGGERRGRRESAKPRQDLPASSATPPRMQLAAMRLYTGPPSTPPRPHLEGRSTTGRHVAARFPITRVESRRQKSAEYRSLPTKPSLVTCDRLMTASVESITS